MAGRIRNGLVNLVGFIRKRRFLIGAVLLMFIVGVAARQFVFAPQKQRESTVVKRGTLREELTLSGKIEAHEQVSLGFQTGGQLAWVGVQEGDFVKKFQTVATLDQRKLQRELQKFLTAYSKQRNTFDQTLDDNQNRRPEQALNDKMKRVLENNQFDLNQTITDVEIQDVSIKLANLFTPIAGIVTRVETPHAGVNIGIGQTPFEIVNPKSIYFSMNADQTEVVRLSQDESGTIILDAYPDQKISGTITHIAFSPTADETETVYPVKISLDNVNNTDYTYRIGMTGDVTFILKEQKDIVYIPIQFVKSDKQGKYVLVGEKLEKRYVKTGMETDTDIEVLEGLSIGERVYD